MQLSDGFNQQMCAFFTNHPADEEHNLLVRAGKTQPECSTFIRGEVCIEFSAINAIWNNRNPVPVCAKVLDDFMTHRFRTNDDRIRTLYQLTFPAVNLMLGIGVDSVISAMFSSMDCRDEAEAKVILEAQANKHRQPVMDMEDDIFAIRTGIFDHFCCWSIHRVIQPMNPVEKVVCLHVNEHAVNGQIGVNYFTGGSTGIPSRDDIHDAVLRCDCWCKTFEGCSDSTDALWREFPGQHNNTHVQIPPMRITVNRERNPSDG